MKKIVLINANPKTDSFCKSVADTYQAMVEHSSSVRRFNLSQMTFNPSLDVGYDAIQPLEPCLVEFQESLFWADHLVVVSPIWWGNVPAKFKGLIDRTFLPGVTFKFEADNPQPVPLLVGKTAHLILTMDAPQDLLTQQAEPVIEHLDRYTLKFCGIETEQVTLFGSVVMSTDQQREGWLAQVAAEANESYPRIA